MPGFSAFIKDKSGSKVLPWTASDYVITKKDGSQNLTQALTELADSGGSDAFNFDDPPAGTYFEISVSGGTVTKTIHDSINWYIRGVRIVTRESTNSVTTETALFNANGDIVSHTLRRTEMGGSLVYGHTDYV